MACDCDCCIEYNIYPPDDLFESKPSSYPQETTDSEPKLCLSGDSLETGQKVCREFLLFPVTIHRLYYFPLLVGLYYIWLFQRCWTEEVLHSSKYPITLCVQCEYTYVHEYIQTLRTHMNIYLQLVRMCNNHYQMSMYIQYVWYVHMCHSIYFLRYYTPYQYSMVVLKPPVCVGV